MSVLYEIGIMANKNVAEALDEFFESDDAKRNWSKYQKKQLSDGSTMYLTKINNHPSWYEIGKRFLAIFHEFEHSKETDDAYRCILVSDESNRDEYCNIIGLEIFEDFNSAYEINYPETFDEDDISGIKKALEASDYDKSSVVMADLLMDTDVSTHKMFEDLAGRYLDGNSEFRKGIDAALTILLTFNMKEVAEKVAS